MTDRPNHALVSETVSAAGRLVLLLLVSSVSVAVGGDWPTWRFDTERSGASPDGIPADLSLLWSRRLPAVRPAWLLDPQNRVSFDASYEPVVMGNLLFLGSQNDGSVRAFDTTTGEEKWAFFTEGPVRCAPACWRDRVFFGSDDGYLYCLDALHGTLRWRFRGAPASRPDRRLLGNGHLISYWPVRGGPVITDDVVCFAAGVWAVHGVFLHALDAATGTVKWSNSNLDHIAHVRIDHELFSDEGLSPQGHLVASGDRLLVPTGRALPAGVELNTGKLIHYVRGFHSGDSNVAVHGELAFVGKTWVTNTYDFREVGSRWAYGGPKAPKGYSPSYGMNHVGNPHNNAMGEAPWIPYKLVQGCDAASAFHDGIAYGFSKGVVYAYNVAKARNVDQEHTFRKKKIPVWTWTPPLVWKLKTDLTRPGSPVVKAGDRVYGSSGSALFAVESLAATPKIAWTTEVTGTPTSLVAADNKLFVATREGWIHCLGRTNSNVLAVRVHDHKPPALQDRDDDRREEAKSILDAAGAGGEGYCLVLGLGDGRLVEELLKQTNMLLIGVDKDPGKVAALRSRLDQAGLLGLRAELFTAAPLAFGFPAFLANLIILREGQSTLTKGRIRKLYNSLRPYGGALCLEVPEEKVTEFTKAVTAAELANADLRRAGAMHILTRKGALPGAKPWTHENADASRSFCAQDDLVKAPLGVLWYGDMSGYSVYKSGPRPIVAGGRVFIRVSNKIIAYDAYTGRFMWQAAGSGALVCTQDQVFVAAGGHCRSLDPETGKEIQRFRLAQDGGLRAQDLRVNQEVVLIVCKRMASGGSTLVCLDRRTGKELWRWNAAEHVERDAVVLGSGTVFAIDAVVPARPKPGEPVSEQDSRELEATVIALDERSGKDIWSRKIVYERAEKPIIRDWLAFSVDTGTLLGGRRGIAHAWNGKTGKVLWADKPIGDKPTVILEQTFITYYGHPKFVAAEYNIRTGEPTGRPFKAPRGGCNYALGGKHLIVARDHSVSYHDIEQDRDHYLINIRSGCSNGIIQADGLLNSPSMARGCLCSYSFVTSFALSHMPETEVWRSPQPLSMSAPPAREAPGAESRNTGNKPKP